MREEKKEERKRAKEEKEEERKRAKDAKAAMRAVKDKAALEITKSKGVNWNKRNSCWIVQLSAHGKNWHLGHFDLDDHTKAVAAYSRHKSMTKTELEALDNSQ